MIEQVVKYFSLAVVAISFSWLIYFTYKTGFDETVMHEHPTRSLTARALLIVIIGLSWCHVMEVL
jgi:hypothetical protein